MARDNDRVNIKISSRAFSHGFDITTPRETFSVDVSPFGELLILNVSGTQIARVTKESFLGSVYDVIISGGGFYQINHDKGLKERWTCEGEGKTIHFSKEAGSRFVLEEKALKIAECKRTWFDNDWAITLVDEAQFKLVACIFLVLSLSEDRHSGAVD